jgi:ATP-dependent Lhr-like helicase
MLKWPQVSDADGAAGRGPTRSVGALVVLVNGALAGYMSRGSRQLLTFLPEDEPQRSLVERALARALASFGFHPPGLGLRA